jgi:hypothetical protein
VLYKEERLVQSHSGRARLLSSEMQFDCASA